MSERKVLNKYISPDYDPSSASSSSSRRSATVRLMAPFSMQCLGCGEFIYRGKKFNARKERTGETYLGKIAILRFYIRCPRCAQEITFCTDPAEADYAMEAGAKRNWEPWRQERLEREAEAAQKIKEADLDALKALERKGEDSKREFELLEALERVKALNARNAQIESASDLLNMAHHLHVNREETEKESVSQDSLKSSSFFNQQQQPQLLLLTPQQQSIISGLFSHSKQNKEDVSRFTGLLEGKSYLSVFKNIQKNNKM